MLIFENLALIFIFNHLWYETVYSFPMYYLWRTQVHDFGGWSPLLDPGPLLKPKEDSRRVSKVHVKTMQPPPKN